jgi:hypothetical protein
VSTGRLRERGTALTGVVVSAAGAAVLLGRAGLNGKLTRDESVYAYAGQQLLHGVAPYRSIFDPKGPVAAFVAAAGAWLGQVTGHAELTGIRLVYGAVACLGVAAVFLLAREVWSSTMAGFGAALGLCCLPSFATDAFTGPDSKGPLVLLISATMWLALCRRWFSAGMAAGVTVLAWQPLLVFPLAVMAAAAWTAEPGTRRRSVVRVCAGLGLVLLAMLAFFVVTRSVGVAFDATVRFPLTGIRHAETTVASRIEAVRQAVLDGGTARAWAWLVGSIAFLVLGCVAVVVRRDSWRERIRDPFAMVVLVPGLASAAYCLVDFQGPSDLIPLLPFAALGVGGLVAQVARLLPSGAAGVVATALLVVLAGFAWSLPLGDTGGLAKQRAQAHSLAGLVPPGSTMWAFGDPRPLVLTGLRNPDRFVYLSSGMDAWKVSHLPGGLPAWEAQILSASPAVAVFGGYRTGGIHDSLHAFFRDQGYRSRTLGPWQVYLAPGIHWHGRSHGAARAPAKSTAQALPGVRMQR